MEFITEAMVDALETDHPMTVRQLFYRLTSVGVIEKTEAEYKGTVCRLSAEMRRAGELPYSWFSDATRWMRRPTTYSSMEEALRRTASTYRRALWDDAPDAVEVWLEKEALAGVLVDVTVEWDVPLMVTRGYPSMSFLDSAANELLGRAQEGQRTTIYYFGDRDPSGVDIDRAVRQGIGEAIHAMSVHVADAPEDEFSWWADFERIAVTEEQIEEWDLPTRPTKKSDSRSKGFKGDSVELDAIPPQQLRKLAADVIQRHVDPRRLEVLKTYEAEEREGLERIATELDGGTS